MFKSLYFKIVLILLVFILAVMGTVSAVLMGSVSTFYVNQFSDQMEENFAVDSPLYGELRQALSGREYAEEQKSILSSYASILGMDRYRNYYVLSMDGEMLSGSDTEQGAELRISPNMLAAMNRETDNKRFSNASYADFALYLEKDGAECIIYIIDTLEEMNQLSMRLFAIILQTLIIGVLIAILLSFFLARAITSPLQSLTKGAQLIAAGEFSHEIDVHSSDEIGILTDSFNNMKNVLRSTLLEIDGEKTKLETVLSCISDAIIAFTDSGSVLHSNESATELFGVELKRNFQMERFFELMDIPLERQAKGIALTADISTVEKTEDGTLIFHDKVYNDRVFDISFGRIRYISDEVKRLGLIAVIHDITSRFELDKSRREFVANVSHELRTPLTSIKGACETLMEDPEMPGDMRDYFLDMAITESDRMTRIVSDLLVLSRLDNKRTQWKVETFDLCRSITRLIDVMRVDIQSHRHRVTFTPKGDIPPLTADKERIEQVIINIISNSIKYTPEDGKIDVTACEENGQITIRVQDNGIGIPEEDIAHIFERFYRVEKSRTSETGGTGLGLAIARELIEAHGGTITIDSELGKGSAVTIVLPVHCTPQ
ncbi:MAG: HAMP domain-containing protein [Clostridia bacterium]|nr:HAMP domain-containing protein [Clostridia bacterium]